VKRRPPKRRAAARPPVKKPAPGADNTAGARAGGFEIAELRQLIRLVQRTGIGELEVSAGGRTVRISAQAPGIASVAMAAAPAAGPAAHAAVAPAAASEPAKDNLLAITSPMVGTFYRAPAPDADPYVEMGAMVEPGQMVCIIEAMKLMNEIESEVKGRIVQILVDNAQPVEFGQKLFLVEPA
jgi:acetyl-CoA carboxylase biotin carboxyl carrier protein